MKKLIAIDRQVRPRVTSLSFGGVTPYGWMPVPGNFNGKVFGHEFVVVANVALDVASRRSLLGHDRTDIGDIPDLVWREREFWWEHDDVSGDYVYKGKNEKGDLYRRSPRSPTWGGFGRGSREAFLWLTHPAAQVLGGNPMQQVRRLDPAQRTLRSIVAAEIGRVDATPVGAHLNELLDRAAGDALQRAYEERNRLVATSLANQRAIVPVTALDRPGMALAGSSRSGGGFDSLAQSHSRRRVLQFEIGIAGETVRITATQILETRDGRPTISKFLIPGMPDEWCEAIPVAYLDYWRASLNVGWVLDQTFELESQKTIGTWLRRAKGIGGGL